MVKPALKKEWGKGISTKHWSEKSNERLFNIIYIIRNVYIHI